MKKLIEVFDFNEEDELTESAAGKLVEKFTNPSSCDSPDLQSRRIQSFCNENRVQEEEPEGLSCEEPATAVDDQHCEDSPTLITEAEESKTYLMLRSETSDHLEKNDMMYVNLGLNTEDDLGKETDVDHDNHGLMFGLNTEDNIRETDVDHGLVSFSSQRSEKSFYAETSSDGHHQLNSPLSDAPSSEQNDMMSAISESLSDQSAMSEASYSGCDEDWMAEHCLDDVEKIDRSTAVIMTSEYVILKDMYCAASLVIFSCNGIKIKSYLANNEEGPFSCEFGVEDIVSIQYNWYQNVGLIILRIQILLEDEKCREDIEHTTDIEELKIAVKEYNWPEKQQKINSLHVKYPAVWNADFEDDVEVSGDNLNQQKRYFPSFDEPFEEVVYPKGDPDAVSICKRDVELLKPETFVNDTIIDFYINYLKNQIQAEEKHRFHFFNSFFFRKLADLDKDPSSIADGKAAFQRVRKWTRKVDMFGKDYIFVPVNYSLHWSLIVICHPGEVANCTDLDLDDSKKVPCILHMDSIKGSHEGLKNLFQTYLCEEWKERHKETVDDISSRFMNLRFVSLELPQQENSFDCGLFLLHYLELFLAEAPLNFSPFKIYNATNFLYLNWFPPAEASLKRTLIQKLISELLENRSREDDNEQSQSDESPVHVSNNTGIEVLSERQSPLIDCNGNMTQMQDDQGIEMTLLERSSIRNRQATNDSDMVLQDLFHSGAHNTGSLLGQLQQPFEEPSSFYHLSNNSLAREQVDMETGEQFMSLNTGEGNFERITETTSPRSSNQFSSWNLSFPPVHQEDETDLISETSKSSSNYSEDVRTIEDNIHEEETNEYPPRETIPLLSATEVSTHVELVVPSSQEDNIHEEETSKSPPRETVSLLSTTVGSEVSTHVEVVIVPSSQENRDEEKPLEHDLEIGDNKTSEDVGDDCDQKEEEEDETRAAKRPRLSLATCEVEEMEEM